MYRHDVPWLCTLALLAIACAEPGGAPGCIKLVEAERYEESVMQCTREFRNSHNPTAGVAAARSCYKLGRGDCVLSWQQRLHGTEAEADVLGLAGYVRWSNGDAIGAAEAYGRQLELYQAAEQNDKAARSAYSLYQLQREAGRFRQALEAADLALEESLKTPDDQVMAAAAYEALHNVFLDIGNLDAAERMLERKKAVVPADNLSRAQLELGKGAIYFYKRRPALARQAFLKGLATATGDEGDNGAEGDSEDGRRREFLRAMHLNLAEVHLTLGEIDGAARYLERATHFADAKKRLPTALLYHRAQLDFIRQRPEEAARALVEALADEPGDDWRWAIESLLGRVEEARHDEEAAEAAYLRSIEQLESMRGELAYDELKTWLLEWRRHPFEDLFALRARQGRHLEALAILERAKARTFLDAFVRGAAPVGEPSTDEPRPGALIASARIDIERAARRAETLLELLPTLGRSPVVTPRPIAGVVEALADRYVLAYFETEDGVWLTAVAHGNVETLRLSASREDLAPSLDRFLAATGASLTRASLTRATDTESATDLLSAAADLGRWLLPRDLLPPPGATLHLVTDGQLGRLPFAALRSAGRYLVEDYDITYLPSLSAQAALLEPRPRKDEPPVVLGDPEGDLPAAARELEWVAERLGVEPVMGRHAAATALEGTAGAGWLHLATHTGLGPAGPWLRLADGDLTAEAIVARRLGPQRVMLASCASAARRGRGLWGSLGAAFLVAGSESVVATLWSVKDSATQQLVRRFYEEGGRDDPVGGLARAQRAWIAAGRPPAEWAPFVHLGTAPLIPAEKGD